MKLLYLSPERLQTDDFRNFACVADISFYAVDEAHCVSQWGREFRPSYCRISTVLQDLYDSRPPIAAFTATATGAVQNDIIAKLGLQNPFRISTGFDRPNLYYEVRRTDDKWKDLTKLLKAYEGLCGIIYCLTRRTADRLCRKLNRTGISSVRYHAGLSDEERKHFQKEWLSGAVPLIVATNAFGMGIDKPDVRFVIHYNMPVNLENYYQEAGRAGRDGNASDCILLTDDRDIRIGRFFISHSNSVALQRQMRHELNDIRIYLGGKVCLRAYLLSYFGEKSSGHCGHCSVCCGRIYPARQSKESSDQALYKSLSEVRMKIAREQKIVPLKIFSNRILAEISELRPKTIWDLIAIEGIPWLSVLRWGKPFLEEIRVWEMSH